MHISKPLPALPSNLQFLDELLQKMCHKRPDERHSAISLLGALHRIKKSKAMTGEADEDEKEAEEIEKNSTGLSKTIANLIKRK